MTGHGAGPAGLLTDLYELRMVESYLRAGMTHDATFSLYVRAAPERPWFVAMGVFRVLELLDTFRYGDDEIAYLRTVGFREETLEYLRGFEVTGEVCGVRDGTVVLADEPIAEITAPLPLAQLVETAVINLVHYPTLVATKAARVAEAAAGRPVVDFGFRRAHGLETGVEAALAAYVGGALTTSNVEAGRRYGIPVVGTMAHSFVQSHDNELDAFRAFARDHPGNVTLLVDTYDTLDGVRNAIAVARELSVQAIRLDSGDLADLALRARRMLDDAGLGGVRIFASGGLDEYDVADLVGCGAPIDAFGVGTDLVTSSDRPALDIAYKLVAYAGRPVAKFSADKASLPGAKQVFRSEQGDVLALRGEHVAGTALIESLWKDGAAAYAFDREQARERAAQQIAALPERLRTVARRSDPPRPRLSDGLWDLARRVRPATSDTT
jgi:nicotinate phosphoribosyltransferase